MSLFLGDASEIFRRKSWCLKAIFKCVLKKRKTQGNKKKVCMWQNAIVSQSGRCKDACVLFSNISVCLKSFTS